MSASVLLVVLAGALLHASWNLLIKSGRNTHVSTASIYIGAGALAALTLPLLPQPARASWPYLGASTATEILYGALLAAAYRTGDLSHAYPLMRGTAPLLVAVLSGAVVGEHLSRPLWIGVLLVSGGVVSMIFDARSGKHARTATRFALLNAFVIAVYTMIDGVGVRLSGQPLSYGLWLFALISGPWLVWSLLRRVHAAGEWRRQIATGIVGGACSLASYTVALWAMARAPVAAVAAVRETAILFGTVLGAVVLHERVTWVRALGAVIITAGVLIIRSA
ncbi:MAG TPA: DMT family transporter [Steroidobacteraceae bacterium]|nr:DMT family transporter [Steroidobacteraceae bacterium]